MFVTEINNMIKAVSYDLSHENISVSDPSLGNLDESLSFFAMAFIFNCKFLVAYSV